MLEEVKKEIMWLGSKLEISTGKIAKQAGASVIAKYGETVVLATVVTGQKPLEGIDFLPLTVNYLERHYASGKIPGGFMKRETKPSNNETLIARLIDRPLRPLVDGDYRNDTQIICTVMAYDREHMPDIVAIIAASAALYLSEVPYTNPVAAVRVGVSNGNYVFNPKSREISTLPCNLVVAGTQSSINMTEAEFSSLSKEVVLGAIEAAHKAMQPVIELIMELGKLAGKKKRTIEHKLDKEAVMKSLRADFAGKIAAAYAVADKKERRNTISSIQEEIIKHYISNGVVVVEATDELKALVENLERDVVRNWALNESRRIDGRGMKDIRPITCEVGILPQVHGSALFTRGETQALVVTTLGSASDEQLVDGLEEAYSENFLLHYNFPPFCVNETGPLKAPGRRELGHGRLAQRAVEAAMPKHNTFPYTIRIVSEIMESNGSSSMATVCGSSLSLMDAGVPMSSHVAGIAMGLIKEGNKFVILSDISGDEDHLGDMDFKVGATSKGLTALQMDIKIEGITPEIIDAAIAQAVDGIGSILEKMNSALPAPRKELNKHAPKYFSFFVPVDKIREIIGPGGKVIKEISDSTECKISIKDNGEVTIFGTSQESVNAANERVLSVYSEPTIGVIYEGKITKIVEFGAFVKFLKYNYEGLIHISAFAEGRVERVEDYVHEGQVVKFKVVGKDKRDKLRLSYRAVDQATGEDISSRFPEDNYEGGSGGGHSSSGGGRPPRRTGGDPFGGGRGGAGGGGFRGGDRDSGSRGGGDRGGDRGGRSPYRDPYDHDDRPRRGGNSGNSSSGN